MLKLTSSDNRYSIVKPVLSEPRLDMLWLCDGVEDFMQYINDIPTDESVVALDFETKGTIYAHEDNRPVGIGLSCSIGSVYLDLSDFSSSTLTDLFSKIMHLPLIAYNVNFDAGWMQKYGVLFYETNWQGCAYMLYKQLASEGFKGQGWSLKQAMVDMLGWEESNEGPIDEWLVANGYITTKKLGKNLDTPEKRLKKYNEFDKRGNRKIHPNKGEMWRVPKDILGHYCCLDCDATWQLWTKVLVPALETIPPQSWEMHRHGFLPFVGILLDNHMTGFTVDEEELTKYNTELISTIEEKRTQLKKHDAVRPIINALEEQWVSEIKKPPQFTKSGKESKNYLNYLKKIEQIKSGQNETLNKKFKFNINGDEMRELVYGSILTFEISKPHEGKDSIGKIRLLDGPEGTNIGAELDMTNSGLYPMDEEAFMQMGEFGKALIELSSLEKLQGYVEAGLAKAMECGDHTIHPQYKTWGTLTGRCSGGGGGNKDEVKANFQQLPDDRRYLSCYKPRPNHVFIQADFTAIEPHCLAEMSHDKTYMELYGPNAAPYMDIYLFIGSRIKKFKDKILKAGYDPWDKEKMAACKAACKFERDKILKKVQLSSAYGAGVYKIWTSLTLLGVEISMQEVQEIYDDLWGPEIYGGVKTFQEELKKEWRENKGWVLDSFGSATPVAEQLLKDVINRVCQKSGHLCLILFLVNFLRPKLVEAGIKFNWIIPDLHDETIYEVLAGDAARALSLHREAVKEFNEWLGGVVALKMEPKQIMSLAERKDD